MSPKLLLFLLLDVGIGIWGIFFSFNKHSLLSLIAGIILVTVPILTFCGFLIFRTKK